MPRQYKLAVAAVLVLALIVQLFLCWRWSREPALYLGSSIAPVQGGIAGRATASTLIDTIDWLLNKPGGYLRNDIYLPSRWLDNMPNFELGVLEQTRVLVSTLRPASDPELAAADAALQRADDSWLFPRSESQLAEAHDALSRYRAALAGGNTGGATFDAGTVSLQAWLIQVEQQLAQLSSSLAASVGRSGFNDDFAGSTEPGAGETTPWTRIDDVFFRTRGSAWALLQFLTAARVDYAVALAESNAAARLGIVIRELEGAMQPLRTPAIMNGGGYGLFANHSLVLGSYVSRAHSALADLRAVLNAP